MGRAGLGAAEVPEGGCGRDRRGGSPAPEEATPTIPEGGRGIPAGGRARPADFKSSRG